MYCTIIRHGDILNIHLAFTHNLCIPQQAKPQVTAAAAAATANNADPGCGGIAAEVSDYRLARLSPAALSAD